MPFSIEFTAQSFDPAALGGHVSPLAVTWNDLLWSALTVGRPNVMHVFRHGRPSFYEAVFRLSMVRMALEQRGNTLHRTSAAASLDGSEKAAVNYFMGLVYCKLFAAHVFNAPWALHFDVFRHQLNVVLNPNTRLRPDLLIQSSNGEWLVFEAKGRTNHPTAGNIGRAKKQASSVATVNGKTPMLGIAGFFYHHTTEAKFYMEDPAPLPKGLDLVVPEGAWMVYYEPIRGFIMDANGNVDESKVEATMLEGLPIAGLDLSIKVHPHVMELLATHNAGDEAKEWCLENREEVLKGGFMADGLLVIPGPSWDKPHNSVDGKR